MNMNTFERSGVDGRSQMADGKGPAPVAMVRLAIGVHFVMPEEPSQVWIKTGQRSARRCHYIRQRVQRFRGRELVRLYELPEVRP
jgi:hypothetical protein